jgi:hypothetical protein
LIQYVYEQKVFIYCSSLTHNKQKLGVQVHGTNMGFFKRARRPPVSMRNGGLQLTDGESISPSPSSLRATHPFGAPVFDGNVPRQRKQSV